ncbi:hypothetical protein FJ364_03535, partial [Candidatus Dependentiae bacterium]|nr:hypothetical protein [Candidatus Dependentiae bacterium]
MKMNKIFLWVPVSVLSMLGNQCNLGSNDKLGQRYIVNYSMIADRTLNERDETKRGILGLGIEEARRGERQFLRRGERRFPLYVDEVAGLTPQFINEGQVVGYSCTRPLESEIGLEVQKIISILSQVKSEKSNIVLIGHPGIDTDLRVYALAERLFPKDEKGMPRCSGVPDNMVNQDIITVDFKLLSEELSGLNSEEYIDFISQNILNAFGNNDIFYLRKIDTFLANKSIKINDLLNLFINHNAKVIIDSSAGNYTNYFDTSAIRAKVFEINLRDLTVAELESYLNKVAQVESIKEGISIPYGTVRKIARLTRAFLPGMDLRRNEGALEVSVAILSRLIDEIKLENGSMNEEDGDKFVYEQINYNLSKDKRTLIATSEANDEQAYSDSAIDFYVDNESMYFVNAKAREYFAEA